MAPPSPILRRRTRRCIRRSFIRLVFLPVAICRCEVLASSAPGWPLFEPSSVPERLPAASASPRPTTRTGPGLRRRRLSTDAPHGQNRRCIAVVPAYVGHPRPEFPASRGRHQRDPSRQILLWRERAPVQVGRVAVRGVPDEHWLVAERSQCFLIFAEDIVHGDARDRALEVVERRRRSILSVLRRLREVLEVSTIQPTESLSRNVAARASCGSNRFVTARKLTRK